MKRLFAVLFISTSLLAADNDNPDLQIITRIRQEGFRNSKVMEIASGLTDVAGPRLTGSPGLKKANEWSRDKLKEFGLTNARLEPFPFGRGWSSEGTTVRMVSPDVQQLFGLAMAWSPSTNGPLRAKVTKAKLETKEDLEKFKGKLGGMIVLTSDPRELKPLEKIPYERYDDAALANEAQYEVPSAAAAQQRNFARRREFRRQLAQFAMDEKIAAIVNQGNGDFGLFDVQSGGSWNETDPAGVPGIVLAAEHYGRLARLLDAGHDVQLEIDIRAQFHTEDKNAYNTLADIPGSAKNGEIVMMGAHIDSWHTGTGATDNAAGTAVMMEAARIIKSLGITPRRTIRIGLWSGEEQGLLGARAYVAQHFATRERPQDMEDKGAVIVKPEHAKISAYFNMDGGTGKLRGIYAQENAAVVPIFTAWLQPLHDTGATTVTMRNTGSTDHIAFDEVGIPGFTFIQDDIEYSTRTHHSNWDTFERLQRADLMQAAVVVATMVWQAANREELLPRKSMPK